MVLTTRALLGRVRRLLPLVLVCPVLALGAGLVLLRELPPTYEATAVLQVTPPPAPNNAPQDPRVGQLLAQMYADQLQTRSVLEAAAAQAGLSLPYEAMQKLVTARLQRADIPLVSIIVDDNDSERAARIANAIAAVFSASIDQAEGEHLRTSREGMARLAQSLLVDMQNQLGEIDRLKASELSPSVQIELAQRQSELAQTQRSLDNVQRSYDDVRLAEVTRASSAVLLESATPPENPVRPNPRLVLGLSLVTGIALACLLVVLAELLDDTLSDRHRVVARTGLRPLASVPFQTQPSGQLENGALRLVRSYSALVDALAGVAGDRPPRCVMITSARAGEGKTMVATSLAITLVDRGLRVALVDIGGWDDARQRIARDLFKEPVGGLNVVVPAWATSGAAAGLGPSGLGALVEGLIQSHDIVLVDAPALLVDTDVALLASHMDCVLLVIDAQTSRGRQVTHALELLEAAGAEVAGAVLNRSAVPSRSDERRPARAQIGAKSAPTPGT